MPPVKRPTMAIASGLPVPAVYVLDNEPAINSFAAGLTSSDAVVTVTRGALEKLNRDELQAVVMFDEADLYIPANAKPATA